jgi:dihydrolipoamide dehydrogenase
MKTVVLGGGPGGYVCAIRLARLGAEVTLVEAAELGGVCLNEGCIPAKTLLHSAALYREAKKSAGYGIDCGEVSVNWPGVLAYKNKIIKKMTLGVASLVKANKIELIKGFGVFSGKNEITITGRDGERAVNFDTAVIAAGARPKIPPIPGVDLEGVVTSAGALSFSGLPESLAIAGGGVIGCEFAELYSSLGTRVTVIEVLPDILFTLDRDLIRVGKKALERHGVSIYTGARIQRIAGVDGKLSLAFSTDGGTDAVIEAEKVLIAAGRTPNTGGLGLERIGLNTERGFIPVDKTTMQTAVEHIYAIGDCIDTPQLAHAASAEGEVAAYAIMGRRAGICLDALPSCVYISPELASVGLTEQQAEERGIDYSAGSFPMLANGRSSILDEKLGLAKIITEKKSGKILGVHLACSNATEIIAQAVLAVRLNATAEQFTGAIAAHPAVHEALHEAALDLTGEAIHIPPKPAAAVKGE